MKQSQGGKLNHLRARLRGMSLFSSGGTRAGRAPRPDRAPRAPERIAPDEGEETRGVQALLARIRAGLAAARQKLAGAAEKLKPRLHRIDCRTQTVIGEAKANNFPESNRAIVQLFLLLVGLAPAAVSLAREKLSHLRRWHIHASGKRAEKFRLHAPKKYHSLILGGGALLLCALALFFSHYELATLVLYRGEPVAMIGSRSAAKRTVLLTEALTTETTGVPFEFAPEDVSYRFRLAERDAVCSRTELQNELNAAVGLVSYGYSLIVNEEVIGSTIYQGALESLLQQVKELYASADTLTIDFLEDVRVAEGYVPTETVANLGQIAERINSTKSGEITYTVVGGDTWGKIAKENGMSNAELEVLNPGYDINKLSIGDVLTISNAVPYLTVRVTERQNYTDDIQYDINYQDDASLYQGDYRILSRGVYGKADVVAEVVYINGVEQERTVISSVTLSDPVSELRARGTKPRPTWLPSGSFRWPTSGRITSYFGYRNTGIRGASTNHKGIDIAVPYGTPIYAADGGTVSFSGYKGAMGYVVIINHGNGFCTYYEHNSSLLVSAGAHVYKGQQIAKAGRSGVASGVHCHFGITYHGSYVNPLKYLP